MSVAQQEEDDDIEGQSQRLGRRAFFGAIGLAIAAIGCGLAVRQFDLGWIGTAIIMALLAGAILLMMRNVERRSQALGGASPAMVRYNRRMMLFSMLYMVGLFGAVFAYKRFHVQGVALWAAGFAPSIGTLGMVWAMARLITEETDEYIRFRLAKASLFATGFVLATTTVWGFLEQVRLVPHVPLWVVLPLFAIALGIANFVRWVKQ